MFVKPMPGLLVPDPSALMPAQRFLPPEGREVPDNEYWRRRLADKEVTLVEVPSAEVTLATPPKRGKE